MKEVNRITICKENYENQEEFESAIRTTVMLLLNADYIMTVKYDDPALGIVCIDFDYADQNYGGAYPYWMGPDET